MTSRRELLADIERSCLAAAVRLAIGDSDRSDNNNERVAVDIGSLQRVLGAFAKVDRALFLPEEVSEHAYNDEPIRCGIHHLSAPHIYANAMMALNLEEGQSFLSLGSGAGYLSCLVGHIIGSNAINVGVEKHHELVDKAYQHSRRYGLRLAEFYVGDALHFYHSCQFGVATFCLDCHLRDE